MTDEDNKPRTPHTESELNGQKLFSTFCVECHSSNKAQRDGNDLTGVLDRIPKGDWFKNFIKASVILEKSDDPYSLKIDGDYKSDYEHNFKDLSDKDIEDIYNYLGLW